MPNPIGMTLWIVYKEREDGPVMTHPPEAIIVNRTNGVELRYKFPLSFGPHPHSPGTHSWVSYIPFKYLGYPIEGGAKMEVSFEINQPLRVKQSGIHLVYDGESGEYEVEATWDYLVDSGERKQKRKMAEYVHIIRCYRAESIKNREKMNNDAVWATLFIIMTNLRKLAS
ncbi:hypothetical protein LguiA_033437 [Lonicera macranthoides]